MEKFTIKQFKEAYPNDDACLDKIFELRYGNIVCPKCESDKKFTKVKNRRSYQCPCCGHQLYPTKGTIFEKTTTPLTYWFHAIYLQTTTRNGVAAKELERQLDVCYKTALRMAHQIKVLMADNNTDPFTGTIECDETMVGGKFANKHNSEKRKIKEAGGNYMVNKATVFGMLERDGKILAKVMTPTKEDIQQIIRDNTEYASIINTDTSVLYTGLNDDYHHFKVNHDMGEYVCMDIHTNTIEGFWSQLKRTIKGTHIKVSKEHLQKYVDEVNFRYQNRHNQSGMFDVILNRLA
jgi:transposase